MAGTDDCLRMVELTCARLCHDLSGLLGTLTGAVELAFAEDGDDDGRDARLLALQASRELTQRLRLMRAAWGPGGAPLSVGGLMALTGGLPNASRITVETSGVDPDVAFPAPIARVLLNLLILGAECLPMGGRILLAGGPDDLFLRILGPRAAWPAHFAACLADADACVAAISSPRALQMPLAALIAHALGVRVSTLIGAAVSGGPPPLRIGGQ